jgi:TPR repeat protein
MKYKNWQEAKKHFKEAVSWLSNSSKIDSQDRGKYSLLVRLSRDSLQYCGQAYAGANNYHEAPEAFRDAMQDVIKKNSADLFQQALGILKQKENKLAVEASDEVHEMLAEIKSAKGE